MKRNLNWLDKVMLAVTFAEAGCPELAGDYAGSGKGGDKSHTCQGSEQCATGRDTRVGHLAANH